MDVKEALNYLDHLNPNEAAWSDPEWVMFISCLMLQAIPRRLGQRLIDAGYAVEYPIAQNWK